MELDLQLGDTLNFADNEEYNWEFVTFGSLTGTFSSDLFFVDTSGFQNDFSQDISVQLDGNSLVVSVIPEPGTLALVGLAALAAMVSVRRKR